MSALETTNKQRYSTFSQNANNVLLEPMFLGQSVNVARYDQQKYETFEKLIEKQLSFFWRPEEIDVSRDRIDYQNLPEHEKHIFLSNLKYQTLLDSIQGRSPNVALLPLVSIPELETWIETWAFSECLEKNTEVLTTDGWKAIGDVTVHDSILVYNPNNHRTFFEKPKRTTQYAVKNRHLLKLKNKNNSFVQMVTPNHRMPINIDGTTEFVQAAYWDKLPYNSRIPLAAKIETSKLTALQPEIELAQTVEMETALLKLMWRAYQNVMPTNDVWLDQRDVHKEALIKRISVVNAMLEQLDSQNTFSETDLHANHERLTLSPSELSTVCDPLWDGLSSCSDFHAKIIANTLRVILADLTANNDDSEGEGVAQLVQNVKDVHDAYATIAGLPIGSFDPETGVIRYLNDTSCETLGISASVVFYEDTSVHCVETSTGAFIVRDMESQAISITGNTIHSRSYTHIIRNVVNDPSEVFDDIVNNEHIIARAEDIACYYDDLIEYTQYFNLLGEGTHTINGKTIEISEHELRKKLYLCLMCVNVLEAVRFYVSFACTFAFAERELMEGNAKIVKLIARDEALHLSSTQFILNSMIHGREGPVWQAIAKECEVEAYEIFAKAAQQEKDWAEYLFKDGSMLGLNKNILWEYVEYITNLRMESLGLPRLFPERTQNPITWINQWLTSDNVQVAPQEVEITSYLVGQIDANVKSEELEDFEL